MSATNDASDPEYIPTDLSHTIGLTQTQLDALRGDRHTIIPDGLERPAHWLDEQAPRDSPGREPPPPPDHDAIVLPSRVVDERIVLANAAPPSRDELATLHRELRSEITDLNRQGGIANLAPNFSRALDRYVDAVPEDYDGLDQITVGLRGEALRAKFASERSELEVTAPEKIGYLEAILFQHGLLAAKLPIWQAFLAEHREDLPFSDSEIATISTEANAIIDTLEQDPDAVDERIPDQLRQFLNAMRDDLDTQLIGARLFLDGLLDILHVGYSYARGLIVRTLKSADDMLPKVLSRGIVFVLGNLALGGLASVFPETFGFYADALALLKRLSK